LLKLDEDALENYAKQNREKGLAKVKYFYHQNQSSSPEALAEVELPT